MLVFGFVASNDRTVQTLLNRYRLNADEAGLAYTPFSNWFTPNLLAFLCRLLNEQIESFESQYGRRVARTIPGCTDCGQVRP